jgi:hypothetical protein
MWTHRIPGPMFSSCDISIRERQGSNLSLTAPRYTNGREFYINGLQEIIHVSRLSFFTNSCTRSFFVSSLKERNYTYSMYLSTGLSQISLFCEELWLTMW